MDVLIFTFLASIVMCYLVEFDTLLAAFAGPVVVDVCYDFFVFNATSTIYSV
jgi:hypothetical protein